MAKTRSNGRTWKVLAGGVAAVAAASAWGHGDAAQARVSRNFVLQKINVAGAADVPANMIVEMTFSDTVDPSSVRPETFQMRAQNATQTGYTKQVFGTFQAAGRMVRFFPRLASHLRASDGEFFTEGSANDNAAENAGFQPATNYEVRVVGRPAVTTAASTRGRPLRRTVTARFATAAGTNVDDLYTQSTYTDAPPPQFSFSNPPDAVPTADTQYATRGGTQGVPNDISVSMFCTRVPLSPATARVVGNVTLTLLERAGNKQARRPVPGSVFIEQNFETTLLSYKPRFPLADRGIYALRVSKSVKDLTEQFDFAPNRERERLRQIYDFLASARADYLISHPGAVPVPGEVLPDPDPSLVGDWPPASDVEGRAVLKENILALGDTSPEEIDPRVMVLFSTRDEPITNAALTFDFVKSDGLFDAVLSTAEYDQGVPGAASAILTIAGGSATDGDLHPTANTTLNAASFPNHEMNFRDVNIPQGVTVTITGTRPVTMKAITILINGVIDVSGKAGENADTGNYTTLTTGSKPRFNKGGEGGPGGGKGGDCTNDWTNTNNYNIAANGTGKTGSPGVDATGVPAAPGDGGQGGVGATMGTGTYYNFGAAGGGGGGRTAGAKGATGGYTFYPSWNGTGGNGGAGSSNDDLEPLVGGAGGGAGGNSLFAYTSYLWAKNAGGAGGGGGAIVIQTSGIFNMGTFGSIRSRGGVGGNGTGSGSTLNAGPGGGGAGGSVLFRSSRGFNFINPATVADVTGGLGGTHSGSYVSSPGGTGGTGWIRTEDPAGGIAIPNGTQGFFDPVGGGVASYVYTKWTDLGVQDPRILGFTNEDIATQPTSNDAIYIEIQATREDPNVFGVPDTSTIDGQQNSTNVAIASQWLPMKVHDLLGVPGGAFDVPGYDPGIHGTEYSGFPVDALNGKGYRFVRLRIYFQLDGSQSRSDPIPFVDEATVRFQFNI